MSRMHDKINESETYQIWDLDGCTTSCVFKYFQKMNVEAFEDDESNLKMIELLSPINKYN